MASSGAGAREQPSGLNDTARIARQKRAAADAAAQMVRAGDRVGLGTGSTVAYLLEALAARGLADLRCVATSPQTEQAARSLGLAVEELEGGEALDIVIDGADEIDPAGWLIKGGGGAHTREKIVAAAARRFVVIAHAEKAVERLRPPVPLELVEFGVGRTLQALGDARLREPPGPHERCGTSARAGVAGHDARSEQLWYSPNGGLIGDYFGPVDQAAELAARLSATPGVVEHGLFAPEMVSTILIAGENGVQRRSGAKAA